MNFRMQRQNSLQLPICDGANDGAYGDAYEWEYRYYEASKFHSAHLT